MRRRSKAGGKTAKARRRKTATRKRRHAPKPAKHLSSSAAGLTDQLALLTRERDEALARENATGEILSSISGSFADTRPVFDAILRNLLRLFGTRFAVVLLVRDANLELGGLKGDGPQFEKLGEQYPVPLDDSTLPGKAILTGRAMQLVPIVGNPKAPPATARFAREFGYNALLSVPLIRQGKVIGALNTAHRDPVPFTDQQVALIKSFADQAVIAIENVRLFEAEQQRTAELTESLEQQTATADVLKVISSSPGDLAPVFNAMLENAARVCDAKFGMLFRLDDGIMHPVGSLGVPQPLNDFFTHGPARPADDSPIMRGVRAKQPVHVVDFATEPAYIARNPAAVAAVELGGVRTLLLVPMLKDEELIGAFAVFRQEVRPFTDKQIELVKNFAAQAVIAIENTRLLNELRQSLQQQTATADVLKVISRSTFDLQSVLDTLTASAARLCRAERSAIRLLKDGLYHNVASYGFSPEHKERMEHDPVKPGQESIAGRAALARKSVHILDAKLDPNPVVANRSRSGNVRTFLAVPLLREGMPIGVLLLQRGIVQPFTDKEIGLAETFADQAVIAIENVRLFEAEQQRTTELTESLEQQTATSEVLSVISSSPGELDPVFKTILERATRICEANFGHLRLYENGALRMGAMHNAPPALAESEQRRALFRPGPLSPLTRMIATKQLIHIADYAEEPAYKQGDAGAVWLVERGGVRTLLVVPMLKENELIGTIAIYRQEVRPFTAKQIALLTNFAAQAVIAIENTRLLNELRESLQQQTATSEVLSVISSSPGDLEPVFQAMLANATKLCGASYGAMWLSEGSGFRAAAMHGALPEAFLEQWRAGTAFRPSTESPAIRAITKRQTVQIGDLREDQAYLGGDPLAVASAEVAGIRTLVVIPMFKDNEPIGVIAIYRREVKPFTDKQIELLTNFAAQAVIAIENTRLLKELRQRTTDLSKSLEDLRTAQDRLVQTEKLASLGQLTAGIAHEIKNPLNFVNNFSAVSVELIDELKAVLVGVKADDKSRVEMTDLMDTLRDNLDKVVAHGKRADSIVKNMLLHSREGSGERRPVDVNALVEESLNLAYHGARAEKQGFNIALERSFDPAAGAVDLFPQEITRVLLNLISNGFYAAAKRKAEADGGSYEPTLSAATKNLGNSVEIRIRDNGTGIPADVKEKMFNPFFTTKPAGEGTGLGLSISHDIIVKQHSGSIAVDTERGKFTEFKIVLPRAGASLAKLADRQ
jgi:GAF domain-containing protein